PQVHGGIGYAYLVFAVAAGLGGVGLARIATGGTIARVGYVVVGLSLLVSTAIAFANIRRRRIEVHRVWMIRSCALVFGSVMFRLWTFIWVPLGIPEDTVLATGVWANYF